MIQGVGNLLPTAWVVQLWEAAVSAECRGTQGGYCLIQLIILVFFHLSGFPFFLPKIVLKEPLCVPAGSTPWLSNKGRTSQLLLGFDQAPIVKRGRNSGGSSSPLCSSSVRDALTAAGLPEDRGEATAHSLQPDVEETWTRPLSERGNSRAALAAVGRRKPQTCPWGDFSTLVTSVYPALKQRKAAGEGQTSTLSGVTDSLGSAHASVQK